MTELLEQKCVPCSGGLPAATAEEINTYKTQIPDWNLTTENLKLELKTGNNI